MQPNLWTVTLRADDRTYRHLIVTGRAEEEAKKAACNIELAPLRAVVKVSRYEGN